MYLDTELLINAVITHLFIKIRKFNESNTEIYSLGLEALARDYIYSHWLGSYYNIIHVAGNLGKDFSNIYNTLLAFNMCMRMTQMLEVV